MSNPRALLITPPPEGLVGKNSTKFHRRFPSLSLLIAASMLRNDGWEPIYLDLNADPDLTLEHVLELANGAEMIVLTTNPYADWQCQSCNIESILELARRLPSERLVITGNHGTHFPGGMIRETGARFVVREEEEAGILDIARALKGDQNFDAIGSLSFKRPDGTVKHNPQREIPSLQEFPLAAYDLIDLKNYYYELLGDNFALLEASRGCPFSCNFCNLSMFRKKYRKRSESQVLKELDELVEKHGCRSLYIFDLEFTVNKQMAEIVCNHIIENDYVKKYGFRWACQTRPDSLDLPLLQLMSKAGCTLIHFGVEAGNEEVLRRTNKGVDKGAIREGIRNTQKAGIKSAIFLIMGHPGETAENFQETIDFAIELNPTYASFHPLRPFPGSLLFEQNFGKGPYWDDPLVLDQTFFTAEQKKEVDAYVKKGYLKFYLRPRYIWSQLFHGDISLYKRQLSLFLNFLKSH
ncbi:MAG: radical SAM protein [Desulfuromonadaceae bacterium]|nr:radical SAM protein [Desulfuromonadaceae bacterium]